ncbi:MAG: hypothetical protein AAF871_03255 [Pseudomonadota bacterium]
MKLRLAISAVGFVLIGIPIILLNLGALGLQAKWETALGGETAVPAPIASAGDKVLSRWANFKEGAAIDALFAAEQFTRRRSIVVSERLSVEAVLVEGETPPPSAYHALWLQSRGPEFLRDRDCPAVLASVGRSCAVSSVRVREPRNDGTFQIDGVLGYLPDEPLGDINIEGPRDLYRTRVEVPSDGALILRPEGAQAAKRALFQQIDALCDQMREELGNCVVAGLQFDPGRVQRDGLQQFRATASLYHVGPAGSSNEELVGTFNQTTAALDGGSAAGAAGMFAGLKTLFGGSDQSAAAADMGSGDMPRVIRGGHKRHTGTDRFWIKARDGN